MLYTVIWMGERGIASLHWWIFNRKVKWRNSTWGYVRRRRISPQLPLNRKRMLRWEFHPQGEQSRFFVRKSSTVRSSWYCLCNSIIHDGVGNRTHREKRCSEYEIMYLWVRELSFTKTSNKEIVMVESVWSVEDLVDDFHDLEETRVDFVFSHEASAFH